MAAREEELPDAPSHACCRGVPLGILVGRKREGLEEAASLVERERLRGGSDVTRDARDCCAELRGWRHRPRDRVKHAEEVNYRDNCAGPFTELRRGALYCREGGSRARSRCSMRHGAVHRKGFFDGSSSPFGENAAAAQETYEHAGLISTPRKTENT